MICFNLEEKGQMILNQKKKQHEDVEIKTNVSQKKKDFTARFRPKR